MRSTRDLIRRGLHQVRKRGQLLAHMQHTRAQYNLPAFMRRLAYPANRTGVSAQFADLSVRKSSDVDLALTILYEIHDVTRFDRVQECACYARLVKCAHQSAGKKLGTGGAKMGNVHLKGAFSDAAVLFVRHTKDGKKDPGGQRAALMGRPPPPPPCTRVPGMGCPSPEPGDNGRAQATSLVMRRPV